MSCWGPIETVRAYVRRLNEKAGNSHRVVTDADAELLQEYVGINVNDLNSIVMQYKATGVPIRGSYFFLAPSRRLFRL